MSYNISTLLGHKQDSKRYMESERLVDNNIAIGVELEVENVDYYSHSSIYPNIFHLWKAVQDGSLREGTEFIFDGPMKGINITDALDVMEGFLGLYKRKDNPPKITDRCSVHVHLDVSDFDKDQLNNLIQVYYLVERVLFQYINPLRIKNNYCRALTDSSFKYSLKRLLKNESPYDLLSIIRNECDKYSALNVLPVAHFGSVEFRHHHGTLDMQKVLEWINIIIALKLASTNYSIKELLETYKESGAITMAQTIFKGSLLSDEATLSSLTDFDELVYKGILDLRELHNLDELKALNMINARKTKSKSRIFLESFKKENGLTTNLMEG
jgi:hypothetical protein